jgi:hypothetical protein
LTNLRHASAEREESSEVGDMYVWTCIDQTREGIAGIRGG